MTSGTTWMQAITASQACFLNYVNVLQQVSYEQMEGSPFSSSHVDAHLSRELERMDIPVMTPKLLAACYFVDRIMACEGNLYRALGVQEAARHQLLSGAVRVRPYFSHARHEWMGEDPIIAGAILLELSELQKRRLEAYKTVMDWKSDVQHVAPDLEEYVHPRELEGLLPALTGLQTYFLDLLARAATVDLIQRGAADAFFFPTGRPDSGNISVLPTGELGTVEYAEGDKTDPTDIYYVTPTAPQVTTIPLDEDATPTVPLPLVVAKHEQILASTPPIPLVREVRR